MDIDKLVQILEYKGEGYKPLVDHGTWRVAILRFIDSLLPENITYLECHEETDEVFVLLSGKCTLFVGNFTKGDDLQIEALHMEPHKLYNIRKGVYHSHTLSKDACVLIVENQNTDASNSVRIDLTDQQKQRIITLT